MRSSAAAKVTEEEWEFRTRLLERGRFSAAKFELVPYDASFGGITVGVHRSPEEFIPCYA